MQQHWTGCCVPIAMRRSWQLASAGALLSFASILGCGEAQSSPQGPAQGDAERGRQLITAYGCGSCHTVPGVRGATALVGPPLWGIADRAYLAGLLPNTEAAMVRWVMAPQEVRPGSVMPDLGVSQRDAIDITTYLQTLRAESQTRRLVRGVVERLRGRQTPSHITREKS